MTASAIFKKDMSEIKDEERQVGKKINFAIIYGATHSLLQRELEVNEEEAKAYLEAVRKKYAMYFEWEKRVKEDAKKRGYILIPSGRIRRLKPDRNWETRIANTIIQSLASDLNAYTAMKLSKKLQIEIWGLIHDSIVFEADDLDLNEFEKIMKEAVYEFFDKIKIQLLYDFEWELKEGKNFADMVPSLF